MTRDYDSLADVWYDSWNRHDLEAIMALYADDIRFTSPYVRTLGFADSGTLTSKADLQRYFEVGLSRIANLHFEPVANCVGADSHTLVYKNQAGSWVAESHEYNEQAQIVRANAAYTGSPA
ncbi:MAG TPA: nuclear transport factor 2 family protein [Asticcacaulis sp.]|nr:nuclear transport factor 2 family protein [Asticcacaulis sp.]